MGADVVPHLPRTLALLPRFLASRYPDADLFGQCRGDAVTRLSGQLVDRKVRELACGLMSLGVAHGDRVAIVSESRMEWVLSDLAALSIGAVTAPVYPTLSKEQTVYILRDCGAALVVVSTPAQLEKVLAAAADVPALRTIVVIDPPEQVTAHAGLGVLSLEDVAIRGRQADGVSCDARAEAVGEEDLATLIYTSGTTGEPKGVMLSHGNLIANLRDICTILPVDHTDTALSFLPLSHSFERMVTWVYASNGMSMVFAESPDHLARDLGRIRPTVMTAVPRVFEKLQARILEKGAALSGLRGSLFQWAVGVAARVGPLVAEGKTMPLGLRIQTALVERLVFHKIREGLGGRFRFLVSGSAALNPDVAGFFFGLGFRIMEGYGLTETSPVLTVTPLDAVRLGAVGVPLPHVQIRIADDGEILAKGPNVMQGYFNRPAETAEVLREGWFHTGDIGVVDADGYLRITDRKKELIVTSGGKKIAPSAIEARFKAHRLVSEAVVVGEKRNFPAVLLVPNLATLAAELGTTVPVGEAQVRSWLERGDVQKAYADMLEEVNRGLAQFERPKVFRLLPREFSQATGELTPTFKVKRRVIDTMYAADIAAIYGEAADRSGVQNTRA